MPSFFNIDSRNFLLFKVTQEIIQGMKPDIKITAYHDNVMKYVFLKINFYT